MLGGLQIVGVGAVQSADWHTSSGLPDALWRRRSLPAQQVRCSHSQLAQRLYGHAGHPDLCSLTIRTHLGRREAWWRRHVVTVQALTLSELVFELIRGSALCARV